MHLRRSIAALASLTSLFLATACAGDELADPEESDETSSEGGGGGEVSISGQSFPEAELVASMYALLLNEAGYTVDVNLVDTRDVYMQQSPGQIDVVPEYVGGIVDFLNTTVNGAAAEPLTTSDAGESVENAESLLEEQGITLLDPSEATDTNAFFVTKEYSENNDVTTLSDLEGETVTLAAHPDCEGRSDCAAGLEEVYGIKIKEVLPLGFASAATYESVRGGESQLGLTSTTDGTLESQGFVLLEDDQQIQPAQNLVPAVSSEFLQENEDIQQPLNSLMAALTTENLTELNARVAVAREKPEDVARDFLIQQGLLEE